ncbi:MAG: formate dehydrogenase, partial [Actinobacteria bacterium]|nr:formate dehydrogenase [Actinomycetota bacterium]NIT95572.1 formate dehydrogenase [Actinomycetota bacterium]NIV55757.1 formate dehydrogenase [Actinomycetota bacterium]NIX50557.1 formate dehydrogenase [Actinomycetota bacterium]
PPIDALSADYPVRMTTGRRLDSYNTGVQSGGYRSPLRHSGIIEIAPEDGAAWGLAEGDIVRVTSRRGAIDVPVH